MCFIFADNVPPEALPSELAAFLNIPLETTDTKLEMAMDMRTGMCKGDLRNSSVVNVPDCL